MTAEWTRGDYGMERLNLELFSISIFYGLTRNSAGENGYVWKASTGAGSARDVRYDDIDKAKEMAERWAHRALARATALLPQARARRKEE